MKQFLTTLVACLFLTSPALAAVLVQSDNGAYVSTYTTPLAVSTAAGVKRVVITTPYTVDDVSFPDTMSVEIAKGGKLTVNNGKTLHLPPNFKGADGCLGLTGTITGPSEYKPEWFTANTTPGTTDMTTAIQKCFAANGVVNLTGGPYLVSALGYNGSNLTIKGQGRNKTIIQTTAAANVALTIANAASSDNIVLKDFQIRGTSANIGGLDLGTVTYPVFSVTLQNFSIQNFTNGYGLGIVQAWWVDSENSTYLGNNDNIYAPTNAVSTSLTFRGINSIIASAGNRGVNLLGNMQDVVFDRVDLSSNTKEAIWFQSSATNPNTNNIVIRNCYIEDNSDSGTGDINISGTAGTYNFVKATIENNFFHPNAAPSGNNIVLDYVDARVINNNGMLTTPQIVTTANSIVYLDSNRGHGANDPLDEYRAMLGQVTGYGRDTTTGYRTQYSSTANTFEGHIKSIQGTAPTIAALAAAGTGATASLDAKATDSVGAITLDNGSGAWSAGAQVTVTFNKAYNLAPKVLITQAGGVGAAYQPYVVTTANGFSVAFAVAASSAATTKWNYLVFE